MSEEAEKNDPKKQFNNLKERLPKRPQLPKKSFNPYWLDGIILVTLIALEFFHLGNDAKEVSMGRFLDQMLKKQHVKQIVIVNGELAEIVLKKEYIALIFTVH